MLTQCADAQMVKISRHVIVTETCQTSRCKTTKAGRHTALTTIKLIRDLGSAVLRSSRGVKPVFQVSALPSTGCWNQTMPA